MATSRDSGGSFDPGTFDSSSGQSSSNEQDTPQTGNRRKRLKILLSPTSEAIYNVCGAGQELNFHSLNILPSGDSKQINEIIDAIDLYIGNLSSSRDLLEKKISRLKKTTSMDVSSDQNSPKRHKAYSPSKRLKLSDYTKDWLDTVFNSTAHFQTEILACDKSKNLERMYDTAVNETENLSRMRDKLLNALPEKPQNTEGSAPSSSSSSSSSSMGESVAEVMRHPRYKEFVDLAEEIGNRRALKKALSKAFKNA